MFAKLIAFYIKSNFMVQILVNIFKQIKIKIRSLDTVITSIWSSIYTLIILMALLNCSKFFWWFYYADTKDIVFGWFCFFFCLNYFQLLFALVKAEVWLIVCLGLRTFLVDTLFLVLLMAVLWLVFEQISLLRQLLVMVLVILNLFFVVSSDFFFAFLLAGISFTLSAIVFCGFNLPLPSSNSLYNFAYS